MCLVTKRGVRAKVVETVDKFSAWLDDECREDFVDAGGLCLKPCGDELSLAAAPRSRRRRPCVALLVRAHALLAVVSQPHPSSLPDIFFFCSVSRLSSGDETKEIGVLWRRHTHVVGGVKKEACFLIMVRAHEEADPVRTVLLCAIRISPNLMTVHPRAAYFHFRFVPD
ncbi:unnamed protein product, partial [Scytosiphon promiscuus]